MEYGTMELPPRVIRQLVTQQVNRGLSCASSVAGVLCGVFWKHCDRARLICFAGVYIASHSYRQLGYEPLEIIQAKSMEEVHEIKKKL
jgi:hypothetical protein